MDSMKGSTIRKRTRSDRTDTTPEKRAKASPPAARVTEASPRRPRTAPSVATATSGKPAKAFPAVSDLQVCKTKPDDDANINNDGDIPVPPTPASRAAVPPQPSPVATSPLRRTSRDTTASSTTKPAPIKSTVPFSLDDESKTPPTLAPVSSALNRRWIIAMVVMFVVLAVTGQYITWRAWDAHVSQVEARARTQMDRVSRELSAGHRHQIDSLHESLEQARQEARLFKAHVGQLQQEKLVTAENHAQELDRIKQAAQLQARQAFQIELDAALDEERAAWQSKIDVARQDYHDVSKRLGDQRAQNQQFREELKRAQEQVEETRQSHAQTSAQLQAVSTQIEEARQANTQMQADLSAQLNTIRAEKEQALQQVNEMEQALTAAQTSQAEAASRATTLQAEMDDLWIKARNLEQNRNDWEALARRLEEELLPGTESELQRARQEVARLNKMVEDDAVERERLRNMVHILEDEKEDLVVRMRQLQD